MHRYDFILQRIERPPNANRLLSGSKHLATGQAQRRVLRVAACQRQQAGFGNAIDQAPNVAPVLGSRAHDAGFGGGVKRAVPEILWAEIGAGNPHQHRLGVVHRVDVALLQQHGFVIRRDENCAKGMMPKALGPNGDRIGPPQVMQHLRWCGVWTLKGVGHLGQRATFGETQGETSNAQAQVLRKTCGKAGDRSRPGLDGFESNPEASCSRSASNPG